MTTLTGSKVRQDSSLSTRSHIPRREHRWIEPLDILVLAGGPGSERDVSLQSGQAVLRALSQLGHRPICRDIGPDDLSALEIPVDFVFIALHGEFGEDGTIQAELQRRGVRYSGCGEKASRTAMNKAATKQLAVSAGVATPDWEIVNRTNVAKIARHFDLPAIIKPISSGSSVDMVITRSRAELGDAVDTILTKYDDALLERYILGREFTVGILGDDALPVCEIRTKREFYDYQAKYIDDDTQYDFDIDLPVELLKELQRQSIMVHRALGCQVLSRVDWMLDETSMTPFFLEVNTIPGFTSHSLVPKAAARASVDFNQLCQRVVELSMQLNR